MADALCGPSNALQNFQKHSQVDRTLQQDRLISRHTPTQSFRSSPGPNAGLLDPEFEAFQAGHIASPPPQFDNIPFHPPQNVQHFPSQPKAALPDWANDFQRLHISPAQPALAHRSPAPAVQQAPPMQTSQTSWHQDFMSNQQMNTFRPQPSYMSQPFPDMSWEYGQNSQFSPIAQGKQRVMEQDPQWDAEMFAAAFEAATQDALAEETATADDVTAEEIAAEREEIEYLIAKKEAELSRERTSRQETNHLTALDLSQGMLDVDEAFAEAEQSLHQHPDALLAQDNIMHEPIHDLPREFEAEAEAQRQSSTTPPAVDEELARTAGHLLDSVSHDTSQKFQESVFLQLMRRLRDKEVTVEGENFVEVSEDPLESLVRDMENESTGSSGTSTPALGVVHPTQPLRIPADEQDADLGRFGEMDVGDGIGSGSEVENDDVVFSRRLPSRPLTPDIDPPAPAFADWRQRLWHGTS